MEDHDILLIIIIILDILAVVIAGILFALFG
nr:MAG TPA: toxin [Caudoviricetes sp.]